MEEEIKKEEEQKAEIEEKEKPLEKMTVKELREIALKLPDLTGVHAMKKDELLKVIKKAKGITEEEPPKKAKKKTPKKEVDKKALKEKVIQLKKEKEAARLAKESKKIDVLRRRINRLKKRTRKAA